MQQESESDTVLEGEKQGGELLGWVALTAGEREWECEEEEEERGGRVARYRAAQ